MGQVGKALACLGLPNFRSKCCTGKATSFQGFLKLFTGSNRVSRVFQMVAHTGLPRLRPTVGAAVGAVDAFPVVHQPCDAACLLYRRWSAVAGCWPLWGRKRFSGCPPDGALQVVATNRQREGLLHRRSRATRLSPTAKRPRSAGGRSGSAISDCFRMVYILAVDRVFRLQLNLTFWPKVI